MCQQPIGKGCSTGSNNRENRHGYGSTEYINHSLDVASSIGNLYGNDAFSDVTFVVQDVKFSAHKVVLAARSEYFRALLYGGLAESSRSVIHLNDINATAFKHVLQYMYTGRLNVRKLRIMLDVLGLAHQYDLRGLESALSAHLMHSLRLSNVWLIYNLAIMYNLEELVNACLKFLDAIAPAPLQSSQFLHLSQAAVERLLSRDSFCAAEIDIFRSLCAWFRSTQAAEARQNSSEPVRTLINSSEPLHVAGEVGSSLDVDSRNPLAICPPLRPVESAANNVTSGSDCERVSSEPLKDDTSTMPATGRGFVWIGNQSEARQYQMMRRCVRFELMSLTELLTEVRASKWVSPDDLLDAISRQAKYPNDLPHRGWMLPGVNLASPRFACSLISGEEGGYPFFFVDDADSDEGVNGVAEIQFSLSALDLTTAFANGTMSSSAGLCAGQQYEDEDDDEDDEDPDDGVDGEGNLTNRSAGQQGRVDGLEETVVQGTNAVESVAHGDADIHVNLRASCSRTNLSNHQNSLPSNRHVPDVRTSGNPPSCSTFATDPAQNRHLLSAALTATRRQASFPTIQFSGSDWMQMTPESRMTDFNQYSTHVRGMMHHPRRSTHSFVVPHPVSQNPNDLHQLPSSSPLVHGGLPNAVTDRSTRWLFPVQRRRNTAPPRPPPPPHSEHDVIRHSLDDPDAHIVIRLGKPSIVNTIRMQLWDRELRCYSYYVEVSLDQVTWHRIVDYRNYPCRSWQTLHFPARVIHYIRVTGTRNTTNRTFHLITFRCMYTETICQQVDGFLIPTYNVASVEHGATVLEGVSRNRNALIDGNARMYDWNSGYTCHQLGNGAIVVQLAQPFLLRSMRLLLWDLDDRTYSYSVHVSTNREDWRLVHDATRERCQSWQIITFPLQLVTFIRVVGSHNTANEVFHLVHLECPYPPAEQPDERASSPKCENQPGLLAIAQPNTDFPSMTASSGAPSEANSLTEHPSYQATQATELFDNSSVLALDTVTDSSVCATELETRPNSPPNNTLLGHTTTESLPHLAPVTDSSSLHLSGPNPIRLSSTVLDHEPDSTMYTSRLSLSRVNLQLATNVLDSNPGDTGVTDTISLSDANRPLSRHLSIGSSVCQLTCDNAAITNLPESMSTTHVTNARSSSPVMEQQQDSTSPFSSP